MVPVTSFIVDVAASIWKHFVWRFAKVGYGAGLVQQWFVSSKPVAALQLKLLKSEDELDTSQPVDADMEFVRCLC